MQTHTYLLKTLLTLTLLLVSSVFLTGCSTENESPALTEVVQPETTQPEKVLKETAEVAVTPTKKPGVATWSKVELRAKLQTMPEGDIIRGETVHNTMMCASCHGATGVSPSRNYPSLAGQTETYLVKTMLDYQKGLRWEDHRQADVMAKLAQLMTEQQIADVSAFYASQPIQAWQAKQEVDEHIKTLINLGDSSRMVISCMACHGMKGQGSGLNPALAGQSPEYFKRAMLAFRSGNRRTDVHDLMRRIADELTDEEIKGLAHYYAGLGEKAQGTVMVK